MESLNTLELCKWLEKKIDPSSLEVRKKGQTSVILNLKWASCLLASYYSASIVNEIDGETLMLLIDDIQEFSAIIPNSLSRLKIKKLVKDSMEPESHPKASRQGDLKGMPGHFSDVCSYS